MSTILLINPNEEETSSPHLGLALIAAYLEKQGIATDIFDRTYASWEKLINSLQSYSTLRLVGITCNTLLLDQALKAARLVKQVHPAARVVFGGTHPTIRPEETVCYPEVDVAVIGEGEITFFELAQGRSLQGVKGIAYAEDGSAKRTPYREYIQDLDALPLPARSKLPMEQYLGSRKGRTAWALRSPATTLICSRGCPFHCTFCSSHLIFGRKVRFRSPENVIHELECLKHEYGLRGIQFHDDTMTLNKSWLMRLCALMIEKKLNLEWFCNARIGTVDQELLQKIEAAGCTTITFGVESGSQRVLDEVIKKGIHLDEVRKTFQLVRQSTHLMLHATFMLGSPGETKQEIQKTIAFAKELNPDVAHFAITIPFPGTELFSMAHEHGRLTFDSWSDFHFFKNAVFESDQFSLDYIKKELKKAYVGFYLRPGYLLSQIKNTRTPGQLKRKLKGIRLLRNVLQT